MRAQVIFGCSKCFENCCSIYTMYILFAYSFFQTSDSSFHYLLVCLFVFFYNTFLYLFIHFDSFLGSFAIGCSFTCLLRLFCAFVYFFLPLFFLSSIVWVLFSFFFSLFFGISFSCSLKQMLFLSLLEEAWMKKTIISLHLAIFAISYYEHHITRMNDICFPQGALPLRGSIPDMTADSKRYIELQNM